MIRNLLATTAVATLIATGAMAQATQPAPTAPTAQPAQPMVKKADGELASNIIGATVYNGSGDDAENIGEVNDIVLSADGGVEAVVVGVGGFLGIGQKNVALEYDLAKWVERDNDRWLVIETTSDALKALPEFDSAAYEPQPADADVAETPAATEEDLKQAESQAASGQAAEQTDDQAAAPAGGTAMAPAPSEDTAAAPADDAEPAEDQAAAPAEETEQDAASDQAMNSDAASQDAAEAPAATDQAASNQPASDAATEDAATDQAATDDAATDQAATDDAAADQAADDTTTAAIDKSTLKEAPVDQIKAEDFVGTTVYGADDENIGEIGDVILTEDGKVDAVIIDVGGFLGMGEKPVAVGMDNLAFMADEDADYYLYTTFTKEQLEAAPAYDESTWAENRDEMRLQMSN